MSDAEQSAWKQMWREAINDLADERDRTILLSNLLKLCRDEYVLDSLEAMERSDDRDLLNQINAALN